MNICSWADEHMFIKTASYSWKNATNIFSQIQIGDLGYFIMLLWP